MRGRCGLDGGRQAEMGMFHVVDRVKEWVNRHRIWSTAIAAVVVIGVIGTVTDNQSDPPGGAKHRPSASTASSAQPSPQSPSTQVQATPPPEDRLTGIGATRAAFKSAHTEDPDPRHAPDCCFLPKVRNSGSSSPIDQYGPVLFDGYADDETINFNTGTPRSLAMDLVDQELPSDARLIRERKTRACDQLLYKSFDLAKQTAGIGSFVTVALFGRFDGPYDPADVESAILITEGRSIGPC